MCDFCLEVVVSFKKAVPLIESLKHESIKPTHWEELMVVAKQDIGSIRGFGRVNW